MRDALPVPVWLRALTAAGLLLVVGCGAPSPPPSILLVVVDTVRADAVSAYGEVSGTTPTMDAIAARGVRYSRAFSNANWTLPSHASLFTGLFPFRNGVRTSRDKLPTSVRTLAERLRAAGYQTAGFSENPWVGPSTNLQRGFDRFDELDILHGGPGKIGEALTDWLRGRRRDAPFFLFVNLMDAHWEYQVRDENPFLPPGVDADAARAVSQRPEDYICNHAAPPSDCAVLRGLYLGGVAAADRKLGDLLRRMHDAGADHDVITVVLSDHGEHLGCDGNFVHDFGLAQVLLHVPLLVAGLPGVAPGVVGEPVQLVDVMPSVLRWAGLPAEGNLPGRSLPTDGRTTGPPRPLFAESHDNFDEAFVATLPARAADLTRWVRTQMTGRCGPDDRVLGDMWAVLRLPFKLMWYSSYPSPQLFDVHADPDGRNDLAASMPGVVAGLEDDLSAILAPGAHGGAEPSAGPTDPAVVERLRALGYLGGPDR